MVDHICPKCGKIYKRKDAFLIHINRKYPCKKENALSLESLKKEIDELRAIINTLTNAAP